MDTLKLYIQIQDGLPINHPAVEENLIDAFGEIPENWEPFIRVQSPTLSNNKIVLTNPESVYRKIDGVWQDYWYYRNKTPEELEADRQAKFQFIINAWNNRPFANNFSTWALNEETGQFEPPIPRPTDGKVYKWCGPENRWKESTPPPQGVKAYFDFDEWKYVVIEVIDATATANNA